MKKIISTFILMGVSAALLSACVSREQADAKLAKGCEAGVNAILPAGRKITRVAKSEFTPATEGPGMRHVKLTAIETDGFLEVENTVECVFEEGFAFLNSSHTAALYQVRAGEIMIGKSGNEIVGDAQQFLKLNEAIRNAMY
ncbi:MAG TPA: hypothetical protein VGD95_06435 [Micavibrio sp.]